jgi:hypothetical protein
VDETAALLDAHATSESWAQKSWTALEALDSYARAKRDGFNGDFKTYRANAAGDVVLLTRWIAMHESELVETNQTFRELRTLPISVEAAQVGRVVEALQRVISAAHAASRAQRDKIRQARVDGADRAEMAVKLIQLVASEEGVRFACSSPRRPK